MKCPACNDILPPDAPECPACGFTLADLAKRFGAIPRYNALLTDTAETALTRRDFNRTRKYLQFFDKRFPQMRFTAFIHPIGDKIPILEYAFYIHNTCRFTPYDRRDLHGSILLFIDPASQRACLMTGYGLEELLPESQLEAILSAAAKDFRKNNLAAAIITSVRETMSALKPEIKNNARVATKSATSASTPLAAPDQPAESTPSATRGAIQ